MLDPKSVLPVEEKSIVQQLTGATSQNDIHLNEEGWTSRVYIVGNGKYVVKFPRREEVKEEYKQEINLYKMLEELDSPVQVPLLKWVGSNNDYLGYEGIVGLAFDQVTLPMGSLPAIGRSLGQFLKQLHALELAGARTITIDDEIKEFQSKFKLIKQPERYFNTSELQGLEKLVYETLPKELQRLEFDPVLCHGDLGYWNLILKDNNQVGVIDFGDIGYWDRSKDFIGMEDEEILNTALEVYGDYPNLQEKIRLRMHVLAILDLRFYIDLQKEDSIVKTVAKLKGVLK